MTTTVYKSSDASAPQMTSAAGSLLTVLDACLVNGYGAKPAAGWSKTVVDAGTNQAYYRQGAKAGFAQKLLYVKDDAATPGNATAWCASTCTVAASPVLTEYFWDQNSTNIGVLLKADQNNPGVAEWMMVASDRAFVYLIRRSGWGERGWFMTFVGDLDTPYLNDKGCFSVVGRNSAQGVVALGGDAPIYSNGYVGVYGRADGVYSYTSYLLAKQVGQGASRGENMTTNSAGYEGVILARYDASDSTRFRGAVPLLWTSLQSYAFSYYAVPEGYEIQGAGAFSGTTFKVVHFDVVSQTKLFLEVAGFTS